ncbi:MAG: ATP-binding protein [Bacteroidales bacterium]
MENKDYTPEDALKIARLEQQLKAEQERTEDLLQIIRSLDSQIFKCVQDTNQDYIITFNEGKVAEKNNVPTRKVKGKRIRDIIGEELYSELREFYAQVFSGNTVKYRGFEFGNKVYSTVISPFKTEQKGKVSEVVGITQEITDQYQMESDYQRQKDILNRIIEHNPYSIQILDSKGYHLSENQAFIDLFKTTPDKNWSILKDPLILNRGHADTFDQMLRGEVVETEPFWYNAHHVDRKYPDNPVCIGSVIFPIFLSDGKLEHIVVMHENITERVKAKEELIIAKEKAEESDRLKSSFLANMSHEIRTPLNGIFGFADLLKDRGLSEDEKNEYADVIKRSGNRMLNIINDLVNISKIEAGQMELRKENTDINEKMKHLFQIFELEAKRKGLELCYKGENIKNCLIIYTDKEKLYSVSSNLLKNAIKYTSQGIVEFGYELKRKEGVIEFFVKDTGPGITSDQQHVIFQRFYQSEDKMVCTQDGAGLGLAISKAYVEMMGGEIWLKSQPGEGSVFYFTIPLDVVDEQNVVSEKQQRAGAIDKLANTTILIVDDDKISLSYYKKALSGYKGILLMAENGKEAVELCKKHENIQLVFMDLRMAVMDGYTATQYIRNFRPHLPVVALTAFALNSEQEKYGDVFDDYLTKPIRGNMLREVINRYLKGTKEYGLKQ